MLGIGELLLIVAILMLLFSFIPTLIALLDVLRHEFTDNNKTLWIMILLLVPVLGPIAYFFAGRRQRILSNR